MRFRQWPRARLPGLFSASTAGPARRRLTTTITEPVLSKDAVVFSGIQPTGVPHLGNYLGALRQWVRLQDTAAPGARLFFCVVDWHALTTLGDSKLLRQRRRETMAALLAVGLDPEKSTLFYQASASPAPRTRLVRVSV